MTALRSSGLVMMSVQILGGDQETNIASIQTTEINTGMHEFVLDLEVSDRLHLSKILRKIRTLNNIVSVSRIHDWEMRQATALH